MKLWWTNYDFDFLFYRFVSQYKITLLHLYSHLGALPVAYEWLVLFVVHFSVLILPSLWEVGSGSPDVRKVMSIKILYYIDNRELWYNCRYRTLDVKNILFETFSHQILPQMLLSPLWEDLDDLLKDYLKFMDDYLRESADLTFLAYRHRNYSKVSLFLACVFVIWWIRISILWANACVSCVSGYWVCAIQRAVATI